jgi:N6-adenosine-specific RNA methylase IME4
LNAAFFIPGVYMSNQEIIEYENDGVIIQLNMAGQALERATTIIDNKIVLDVAHAAKIFCIRQKLSKERIAQATYIEVSALKNIGELLKNTERAKGTAGGGNANVTGGNKVEPPVNDAPTLTELGLTKKESSIAQTIASLDDESLETLKSGNKTVNQVVKEKKTEQRNSDIAEQRQAIAEGKAMLPSGVFEVIVIDPPWNYGRKYDPDSSRVANPYPEMAQSELLKLEIPFADDAVCFLWTTHKFIWDAKELLDKWRFEYKANLVWDKESMGIGSWLRMQCEFCLIGIKGKPTWINTEYRDIIREKRREHSRKPESFYNFVEAVTVGRKLDYFSREQRAGWATFGNDASKF